MCVPPVGAGIGNFGKGEIDGGISAISWISGTQRDAAGGIFLRGGVRSVVLKLLITHLTED